MHFLALSGSLRDRSTNSAMLRTVAEAAPEGTTVEVFEGLGALPLFSPDREANTPQAVQDFAARVAACDGLLIACPEYAHGIPGAFKNALDWLVSRFEIPGKPVMLMHGSTRGDHVRSQLREVLQTMSCRVFPGSEFEIHLIGKDPQTVAEALDAQDIRAAMRSKLTEFSHFIAAEC